VAFDTSLASTRWRIDVGTVPRTGRVRTESRGRRRRREGRMSATDEYYSTDPVTGWVGWIMFASIFMLVIGAMNAFQGLAALFRDKAYWVTIGGNVVTFDVTAWGWIHLIFGILLFLVGVALMRGSTFARVIAIGLVGLNLIAQFGSATLYPFWAIVVIAIDVVILYALIVHGRELQQA
jgi:hypothetical protein